VYAVAFSPDGRTVLTGTGGAVGKKNEEARLWDARTGQLLGEPLPHDQWVVAVAFSPDGKTILAGSAPSQLWDAVTHKPIGAPLRHDPLCFDWSVAFSPDGRTAATGGEDYRTRLWESATGRLLGVLPLAGPQVAFSPDGKTLLTGGGHDGIGRLWETETRQPLGRPLQHDKGIRAVAFSPDSRLAATASNDGTARFWDAASGLPIGPPLRHRDTVSVLAFSPDGKFLVTGSTDRTARLWEVPAPAAGSAERLKAWVEVMTSIELDEHGGMRMLDEPEWQQRRHRLQELGGGPLP
jgi:WD40 repeat protein